MEEPRQLHNVAELWAPEIAWIERDQTYYVSFSIMERGVDKEGRYWTTMFGNDVTSPYRRQFGLIPLEIGDQRVICVPAK